MNEASLEQRLNLMRGLTKSKWPILILTPRWQAQ